MTIRTQPNRWSCVPSAFATVLDIEIQTLLELIGHDGSEIIFPDLEEPFKRRAFNLHELSIALWDLGYIVGNIDVEPFAFIDENHLFTINFPHAESLFAKIMGDSVGVGCGKIRGTDKTHAFAWNGEQCFDPLGFIYPLSRYELYTFCPIQPRL